MTNHIVFFELYGKKMKAEVMAQNEAYAKQAIRDKIIFHKIEDEDKEVSEVVEKLFKIFGIK